MIQVFRVDKQTGSIYICNGENGEHIMIKDDGSKKVVPDPRDWYVGAAFLSKCFGISVQRIYQLRDLGVLCPEDEKDQGEQVFLFQTAMRDFIEFRRNGRDGMFSNGPIRKGVNFGHLYSEDDEFEKLIMDFT